jgi:hypothetical protein
MNKSEPAGLSENWSSPSFGRDEQCSDLSVGSTKIITAPDHAPPFDVDAVAYEEDTLLVLSDRATFAEPRDSLKELVKKVIKTPPRKPGSVIVKGKHPVQLLAVVHDLNVEPSWTKDWIANALEEIFHEAETRKLESLALPLLGTIHGSYHEEDFVLLLREVLQRRCPRYPERIWLIVPDKQSCEVLRILD